MRPFRKTDTTVREMKRPFSRKIAIKSGKLPAGTRIYAIGDIHGRADLLERTISDIDQHLKAYPIANAIEIMLGDYIDRGPRSDQVIELLTSRSVHRQTICLLGNHETYLLEFLRDPASLAEWQRYGGLETLMAYGLAPSLKSSADDQKNLAALLANGCRLTTTTF
jgi:serine/threonine protein phosphatase 1